LAGARAAETEDRREKPEALKIRWSAADIRNVDIRLSELVSALSHALDVTGGQPMGHAERTCLIGLRLADAIGLEPARRSSLFYALLLKDAGCSTTAAATAEAFGSDDLQVKRESRLIDINRPALSLGYLKRNVAPGAPLRQRARHLRTVIALSKGGVSELQRLRCERGADIARGIGLDEEAAAAIGQLFEHWDGHGHPGDRSGDQISLLARIACLAQSMEVFWQQGGPAAAVDMARARRGTWYDPALVDAVGVLERDSAFWAGLAAPDVQSVEPTDRVERADADRMGHVAEAFASIVDAKSPYTARHSAGVAEIGDGIAATIGLDDATRGLLHRAALLHDLGKLGVSNLILDKPGKLTETEWAAMRRHPAHTLEILTRVGCFRHLAAAAAAHHERLDGRGYHLGLEAGSIALEARILCAADICDALRASRPYRAGLPVERVLEIMGREVGHGLGLDVYRTLRDVLTGADADHELLTPAVHLVPALAEDYQQAA
jgi:HD-GYP domain-containing protein (c-di-GMP phosphodiesterase class II)